MTETLSPEQKFISMLTDIVLANLENEDFGVNDLARESGLSLYTISRKLYSIKKIRINQFIREVRLNRAMELLREGTITASEVSYKVGFGSPAYFNKCFRELFGCTPGEVKKADLKSKASDNTKQAESEIYKLAQNRRKRFTLSLTLLLIAIFGITGFLIFGKMRNSEGRLSIAVMPFRNLTNDTNLNLWQESIQEGLISSLSNNKELRIRQKESVNSLLQFGGYTNYASISPTIAGKISKKLIANLFVFGSIAKAGNDIRVDAQLIDTKTKEVLRSFAVERPSEEKVFFQVIDTISQRLTNFLLISRLIKENPVWGRFPLSTNSPEALRYAITGSKARSKRDFSNAIFWYSMAVMADSNYVDALIGLENAYAMSGNLDESRKLLIKNYSKRDRMNNYNQIYASWSYALSFESPEKGIMYLKQLQELDDQWPRPSYLLGLSYNLNMQYYNAITAFEKTFALYKKWGRKYGADNSAWSGLDFIKNNTAWEGLGIAYHKTGQYNKERRLYRKAMKYIPDDPLVIVRQAQLSYSEKDSAQAMQYIEKFLTVLRKRGYSEAHQSKRLGDIYAEAGLTDKAEKYYRRALSLEPSDVGRMKALAGFFIDNNRNPEEALSILDKAIAITTSPYSYYEFMDMKGRCLLKQGRSREALEILEKTYSSTPYKVWFIYADLLKAREAVASLK